MFIWPVLWKLPDIYLLGIISYLVLEKIVGEFPLRSLEIPSPFMSTYRCVSPFSDFKSAFFELKSRLKDPSFVICPCRELDEILAIYSEKRFCIKLDPVYENRALFA